MNKAATQTLENMPAEPVIATLRRLAGDDYVQNLPDTFWSPVHGQKLDREAYEFNFDAWQVHYKARQAAMQTYIQSWLERGGTILESFSDTQPTSDFTQEYRGGTSDVLWNCTGTRRIDIHGSISDYQTPFLPKYMNPKHLAEHLTCRSFGFRMRVATWLESPINL